MRSMGNALATAPRIRAISVVLATAMGCGADTAGDMSASPDVSVPGDLRMVIEPDLTVDKRDQSMNPVADMSLSPMDALAAADMSMVIAMDLATNLADGSIREDQSAVVTDGGGDAGMVIFDAAIGDGARADFFVMGDPGLGVFDAIMDGPGRLGDTPNCTGAPTGACQMCIGMSCANQVLAAFGANWQVNDKGSLCDGVYACSCNCMVQNPNNSSICPPQCAQQKGGACAMAFAALATCVMNNCANPCK